MAHFEATVRLLDVIASDPPGARRAIEERLRAAGFSRWQIVRVGPLGATTRRVEPPRRLARPDASYLGGGLLVAAGVAWTLWFLWILAS
jgi:hypothetical protein